MANLKIIWTTGASFSPSCIDKIAYEISPGRWNVYRDGSWCSQSAARDNGYRPATAEEIAEHWNVLHPKWNPEPGDKVIITQDIGKWCNKKGTIVEADGSDYWIVKRDYDGHTCNFMKQSQMILAPYEETAKSVETPKSTSPESRHGFTIGDIVIPNCDNFKGRQCIVRAFGSSSVGVHCPLGASLGGHTLDGHCPDNTGRWYHPSSLELVSKVEPETVSKPSTLSTPSIPIPKEGYVTIRIFTEEEFKAKDLWSVFEGQGYPKGWNMDGKMNKYLGTYIQVLKSSFCGDHSFGYESWSFKSTDYEVIHKSVEPKVEPKEPEMKPQRFKVGDKVTYKAKSECNGYRHGGTDHSGYEGTITSYGSYYSEKECYGIQVTSREGTYSMIESEFHEYDGSTPVKAKESKQPEKKFAVGDKITYKSHSDLGRGYRFGGGNFGGEKANVVAYLDFDSEYNCYKMNVTVPASSLIFSMLECEFYEYDTLYPGTVTLGTVTLGTSAGSDLRIISAGTANTTFLGTVGLQIHQTVPKPKDDLAKYDQTPVTLHKKPKTKLITVNTY